MSRRPMRRQGEPLDISSGDQPKDDDSVVRVDVMPGRSVIDLQRIPVGTSQAIKILDAGQGRHAVRFFNDGGFALVIGGPNVTVNSGLKIGGNQGWDENDAPDAEWWAIALGGNTNVRRQIITRK